MTASGDSCLSIFTALDAVGDALVLVGVERDELLQEGHAVRLEGGAELEGELLDGGDGGLLQKGVSLGAFASISISRR